MNCQGSFYCDGFCLALSRCVCLSLHLFLLQHLEPDRVHCSLHCNCITFLFFFFMLLSCSLCQSCLLSLRVLLLGSLGLLCCSLPLYLPLSACIPSTPSSLAPLSDLSINVVRVWCPYKIGVGNFALNTESKYFNKIAENHLLTFISS